MQDVSVSVSVSGSVSGSVGVRKGSARCNGCHGMLQQKLTHTLAGRETFALYFISLFVGRSHQCGMCVLS